MKINQISNVLQILTEGVIFFDDGEYWVAIKPCSRALKLNPNRIYRNLMKDNLLKKYIGLKKMKIKNSNQHRYYTSLPESVIYLWLLTIRSKSNVLYNYRAMCCNVLYEHFNSVL